MTQTTPLQRVSAGARAALVTGQLAAQAVNPAALPPAQPDLRRTNDATSCQTVPEAPTLPTTQQLARDLAKWKKEQIVARTRQAAELGRDLREPEVREERSR